MRRRIQSHLDYYRYVYSDETSLIWGLLLLLLTFVIVPEPWFTVVLIVSTVVTALFLAKELFGVYRKWVGVRFRRNPVLGATRFAVPGAGRRERALQVAGWRAHDPQLEVLSNVPPGLHTEVWFDSEVDAELLKQSEALQATNARVAGTAIVAEAVLAEHSYALPSSLADIAPAALRLDRASNDLILDPNKRRLPIRFNGHVLRLATEPTLETLQTGDLRFERVRYFDGEVSNELWRFDTIEKDEVLTPSDREFGSPVKSYVLDRSDRIKSLEHASAANIVGISIMAVTSDEHLVFVRQTAQNSIAPQALAASGSGSLELRDFDVDLGGGPAEILPIAQEHERPTIAQRRMAARAARDETELPFARVLLRGMLREMAEESGLRPDQIMEDSARVTGYFRWIERAMKPEFVGIVRLNCAADELPLRPEWVVERAFTKGTTSIGLSSVLAKLDTRRSYTVMSNALNTALNGSLEAEFRGLRRAYMSPSCEHAAVIAARFLTEDSGRQWLARYAPNNRQN